MSTVLRGTLRVGTAQAGRLLWDLQSSCLPGARPPSRVNQFAQLLQCLVGFGYNLLYFQNILNPLVNGEQNRGCSAWCRLSLPPLLPGAHLTLPLCGGWTGGGVGDLSDLGWEPGLRPVTIPTRKRESVQNSSSVGHAQSTAAL